MIAPEDRDETEAGAQPDSPPSGGERAEPSSRLEENSESSSEPSGEESESREPRRDGDGEENAVVRDDDDDEEEEEETCGFCIYMKGGGCKQEFVAWMECVDREKEGGGDYVEECIPPMQALRECMLANPDYYGPMLEEEENRMKEREAEEEGEGEEPSTGGGSVNPKDPDSKSEDDPGSKQGSSKIDPESKSSEALDNLGGGKSSQTEAKGQ
ncbi:hypothetical protein BSKO_10904 [Bryopsis sp. KO-2023]|nr:hypothetical protein BSKO_10904 [Bryopsis sp. KO-2023]